MRSFNKIFCIGPNKTGTTSLHDAFLLLGLRSVHYKDEAERNIQDIIRANFKNGESMLKDIEGYDAYSDWIKMPTLKAYKQFDKEYPNSKFILSTRNMEDWLNSREKHVRRLQKEVEETGDTTITWLTIDRAAWKTEFEDQHSSILAYFKGRENDLLVFNVFEGDGWEKLCPFLGMPVPDVPFPDSNKAPRSEPRDTGVAGSRRSLWKKLFS
jgi:hypothetical protein